MKNIGQYAFPIELQAAYSINCSENDRTNGGWREHIAEFRGLSRDGAVMEFEEYDYIHWKTLRDAGRKPRAIYAGAILVCPDTASIYVHKRSPDVATEPGKYHSFLGGFIVSYQNIGDDTLLNACLRELHEESASQPTALDESRIVIVENLDIGWIDVVFMAGVISERNARRLKGSKEGAVESIPLREIEDFICDNREMWVTNGIAHHLIWLRLGAPGAPAWFREDAFQRYNQIVHRLSQPPTR